MLLWSGRICYHTDRLISVFPFLPFAKFQDLEEFPVEELEAVDSDGVRAVTAIALGIPTLNEFSYWSGRIYYHTDRLIPVFSCEGVCGYVVCFA